MRLRLTETERRAAREQAWQIVKHDRRYPRWYRQAAADALARAYCTAIESREVTADEMSQIVVPQAVTS